MPVGPGKYGARAEALLREVGATAVMVITIDGRLGHAFDLASTDPRVLLHLPAILREVAAGMDKELATARAAGKAAEN